MQICFLIQVALIITVAYAGNQRSKCKGMTANVFAIPGSSDSFVQMSYMLRSNVNRLKFGFEIMFEIYISKYHFSTFEVILQHSRKHFIS